jgi:hypothetical protein
MPARNDSGLNRNVYQDSALPLPYTLRTRVTLAQLNAGFTLLAAIAASVGAFSYRLIDATLIAVGGAATTGTSVNIIGTRAAAPVQLLVVAVAALTQSALVRAGAANAVILADGASFSALDVNTPITVITVGSAMTVMTNLDVVLTFAIDG